MHVTLRDAQTRVPRELHDRLWRRTLHRKVRTEGVSKGVPRDLSEARSSALTAKRSVGPVARPRRPEVVAKHEFAPQVSKRLERRRLVVRQTDRYRGP